MLLLRVISLCTLQDFCYFCNITIAIYVIFFPSNSTFFSLCFALSEVRVMKETEHTVRYSNLITPLTPEYSAVHAVMAHLLSHILRVCDVVGIRLRHVISSTSIPS